MIIKKFSKKGKYHKLINAENQDFVYAFENTDLCYVSIADGASSSKKSRQGAEIACKCVGNLLLDCDVFSFDKDKIAYVIWEEIMFHIRKKAIENNIGIETFASTYAFACINKHTNMLVTYNLGDGAVFIKYDKDGRYNLLSAPKVHNGNCTLIPNVNAYKDAQVTFDKFFKGSVLLCTDGFYDILKCDNTGVENIIEEPERFSGADDVSFIIMENYNEVNLVEGTIKAK